MTAARSTGEGAVALAQRYWALMQTNDWAAVGAVLADDFVLEWPQSNERIRGRERYAQMNAEYPAAGRWRFTTWRLFGDALRAVSEVEVTDGSRRDVALTFFEVRGDRIARIVEYWPEPFAASPARAHLTEPMATPAP
jgi:ketosteroid isomerase-like protein